MRNDQIPVFLCGSGEKLCDVTASRHRSASLMNQREEAEGAEGAGRVGAHCPAFYHHQGVKIHLKKINKNVLTCPKLINDSKHATLTAATNNDKQIPTAHTSGILTNVKCQSATCSAKNPCTASNYIQ